MARRALTRRAAWRCRPSRYGISNIPRRISEGNREERTPPSGCPGANVMSLARRRLLQLAGAALAAPAVSRAAFAQGYPARPVRLVIGYTPGGSADLTA